MNFLDSIKDGFRKYAEFEGRATRPQFWWFILFIALVQAVCNVFVFIQLAPNVSLGSVFSSLVGIATLLPTLAVGVRRLRDAGLAWQNIFWLLLPIAGIIILVVYWVKESKAD